MYTQCPQCLTIFEIDEDALQAALGIVECGHCASRFDALQTLSEKLPHAPDASLPERRPDACAPTLTRAVRAESLPPTAQPKDDTGTARSTREATDDWFPDLPDDLTAALIADAAGIPPEAAREAAWEITDDPDEANPDTGTSHAPGDVVDPAAKASTDASGDTAGIPSDSDDDAPSVPNAEADEWPDDGVVQAAAEPMRDAGSTTADSGRDDVGETIAPPSADRQPASELRTAEAAASLDALEDPIAHDGDSGEPPDEAPGDTDTIAPDPDEPATAAPVYVPPPRGRVTRTGVAWWVGCVLLAVLLAAQLAWVHRVDLYRNPSTRAWVERVCHRIQCRLPPIRDTAMLELLSRDIRPDPVAHGALVITATLRNDARFRQPWPTVVVSLTDLDNKVVAMRRFRPAEYMPDAVRRNAGIAPGATAAVAFEVLDPGSRAVAFRFAFE